jgi:hypothetical protein
MKPATVLLTLLSVLCFNASAQQPNALSIQDQVSGASVVFTPTGDLQATGVPHNAVLPPNTGDDLFLGYLPDNNIQMTVTEDAISIAGGILQNSITTPAPNDLQFEYFESEPVSEGISAAAYLSTDFEKFQHKMWQSCFF